MKALFKVTAVAALMAGAVSMAHAASAQRDAQVEITGNIVDHTCDLSIPQSTYDLGNHTPLEFGAGGTANEVGAKQFLLKVQNCTGTLAAVGDLLNVRVNQTGADNGVDSANFWGDDGGTNAGIILKMSGGVNSGTAAITPLSPLYPIHKAAAVNDPISGRVFPITVTAAMKGAAVPLPGALKANLQFTME